MNKWETAKAKLDAMEFPSQSFFYHTEKPSYVNLAGETVTEDRLNGVYKTGKRHKFDKSSHPGMSIKASRIMTIDGYATEFIRDYCLKCKKATRLQGVVFNYENGACYVRTFMDDKQDVLDVNAYEEFMGSLA